MTSKATDWRAICALDEILPDTGICALVDGKHVAVFRLAGAANDEPRVFAIDNVDPNAKASVLSRGLVGSLGERIVVASPIYKHHFCLESGECLEAPHHSVSAYQARVQDGRVLIAA